MDYFEYKLSKKEIGLAKRVLKSLLLAEKTFIRAINKFPNMKELNLYLNQIQSNIIFCKQEIKKLERKGF